MLTKHNEFNESNFFSSIKVVFPWVLHGPLWPTSKHDNEAWVTLRTKSQRHGVHVDLIAGTACKELWC